MSGWANQQPHPRQRAGGRRVVGGGGGESQAGEGKRDFTVFSWRALFTEHLGGGHGGSYEDLRRTTSHGILAGPIYGILIPRRSCRVMRNSVIGESRVGAVIIRLPGGAWRYY